MEKQNEKSSKDLLEFKRDLVDNPYVRAENEDDDGYDPYSDRVILTTLFEEDPWR